MKNKVRSWLAKLDPTRRIIHRRLKKAATDEGKPRSVIFYTTHKCASSFMNEFFGYLAKDSDYRVVDFATGIWSMGDAIELIGDYEPFLANHYDQLYRQFGEIYTPQRLPLDFPGRSSFRHIFFLRDPRDVVVSAFYSFGYSHVVPKGKSEAERFLERRTSIQNKGIDQYARDAVTEWILPTYNAYRSYREETEDVLYLSYPLFNQNLSEFVHQLSAFLGVTVAPSALARLLARNEAGRSTGETVDKHRRSGKSGQFREKLSPETVAYLDDKLEEVLTYWEFNF